MRDDRQPVAVGLPGVAEAPMIKLFGSRVLLMAWALTVLTGCASLSTNMEPPRVSLSNVRVLGVTLLEQQYVLTMRIQNPNDRALHISGLSFELDINGEKFANGVSNQKVTIPGYGQGTLDVTGTSTLAGLLRQLSELEHMQELKYELKGKVKIADIPVPIPFEYEGVVPLSRQKGAPAKAYSI